MIEAGQFLSTPGAALSFLSGLGIIGLALSLGTLTTLRTKCAVRLVPTLEVGSYCQGIALAAAISVALTLLLQVFSLLLFDVAAQVTSATVNQVGQMNGVGSQLTKVGVDAGSHITPGMLQRLEQSATRNKRGVTVVAVAALVLVLLLVVGAGYAFTALDLSFLGHFAAFSAGVGPVEEFSKAAAGLAILYFIVPPDTNLGPKEFERRVLASFGIAGLGFGAGEALHYFGIYAAMGGGLGDYAVRAIWCVTLHGAWTLIVGRLLVPHLPRDASEVAAKKSQVAGMVVAACIPMVLVHAFYNTCCLHGNAFFWVVGAVSIGAAAMIIESSCEEAKPVPNAA